MHTFFRSKVVRTFTFLLFLIVCTLAGWLANMALQWKGPASVAALPTVLALPTVPGAATLQVKGTQWGVSSCYIGAVEGSTRFDIADMKDLGINTYRIYGGMSRWEPQDDSQVYGSPSIVQMKANPAVINWAQWDQVMSKPALNSDYAWVPQTPRWQGSARTLFSSLKEAGIRPVVTLRNKEEQYSPSWAPRVPTTHADWNEWWEHVFATVYWLNVRNDYNVNDFEVHNEPNAPDHGWTGTQQQYITFLEYTYDAINYVYKTYLPGRSYALHAPGATTGSDWGYGVLKQAGEKFNTLGIHDYNQDSSPSIKLAHSWLKATGHPNYPIWLSEWGSFERSEKYDTAWMGVGLIANLIRMSQPGDNYVYGSHIFSLYDFGQKPWGLIRADGSQRLGYYALRMAIRALQGCRPTYQTSVSDGALQAITTRGPDQRISVLVTNQDRQKHVSLMMNLTPLVKSGEGQYRLFDGSHRDQAMGSLKVQNGQVQVSLPPLSAMLFVA
jgi:hypothetical protein